MLDTYDPPRRFASVVYVCLADSDHILYIEPDLKGVPGGLIACPFKDGIMELKHGIELEVSSGANIGLQPWSTA